jgi:hypothetical protein
MSTKYIYLRGKVKWAMVRKPDEKYNNYKVNLYFDEASQKVFRESGLRLEAKNDEDGEFYTFRRPASKLIKGEAVNFGPPKLLNADNSEFPDDKLVGNGSDVTIKVTVYDTVKGKGHRLEVVRVENLVEFIPEAGGSAGSFIPPHVEAANNTAPKGKIKGETPKVPF